MFRLDKWYLDLVTDAGTAIVAYSARLTWGRARVGYGSVLVSRADAPVDERSVFGSRVAAPQVQDDHLTWTHPALKLRGIWQARAAPIAARLLENGDGWIDWTCDMPRSRVTIDLDGRHHAGLGYVEHQTLTIPPWKLPFRRLRWGRYVSDAQSVVWIAWEGTDTRHFIWHNGVPQPDAILDDHSIRGLEDEAELQLDEARDVCARPALARLITRLPARARPLAAPVAAMFEHKMLAGSRVVRSNVQTDAGWSLFEEVRW